MLATTTNNIRCHSIGNPHHSHFPRQNHTATPEQQAFMRLQRDRKIQQRLLQRQQQQQQQELPALGALMTHAQTPSQLPASSSVQNAYQNYQLLLSRIHPNFSQAPI
ncbi:hypothetical protein SOVF_105160 [Spinacia oleracea]|nr:hypothetical protein SOVF_105160 [Spinacia oleracea]